MDRTDKIRVVLEKAFSPEMLIIEDESHLHAGHKSAGGLGHFNVKIMAGFFDDLSLINSHKEIYAALGSLMETDIHALSIKVHKNDNKNMS